MSHNVKIGGREVVISWNQETARIHKFRISELGTNPFNDLRDPIKAESAWVKILWSFLPESECIRHKTPERLYVAIDQESETEGIVKAITGVIADMNPTKEKKTTSQKSPSQKLS